MKMASPCDICQRQLNRALVSDWLCLQRQRTSGSSFLYCGQCTQLYFCRGCCINRKAQCVACLKTINFCFACSKGPWDVCDDCVLEASLSGLDLRR